MVVVVVVVVVVDVVFVVFLIFEINAFVGSVCPRRREVGTAPALEWPLVQPARVGRKTPRATEKRNNPRATEKRNNPREPSASGPSRGMAMPTRPRRPDYATDCRASGSELPFLYFVVLLFVLTCESQ